MWLILLALVAVVASGQGVLSATSERTRDGGSKITIAFLGPPPVNSLAAVVRGAPYSAEQTSGRIRNLADGTKVIDETAIVQMFRDSAGRRRIDSTQPGPKDEAGVELIEIRDYVANLEYTLDVANHVAHRMKFLTDPKTRSAVVLPHDRFESIVPVTAQRQHSSLGTRTIEGLLCDGTRETTTIPAGAEGNDQPIITTVEVWNSRDLKIRIESTSKDPRVGETFTRMRYVRRDEPAATLFQVSQDYPMQDETGRFAIEVVRPAIPDEERPVRALIKAFADARNAHDGRAAAATYAPGGEYRAFDRIPLQGPELESLWGGTMGQMSRTVRSVQFVAPTLAIVVGDERFVGSEGESLSKEAFTVIHYGGQWKILVHQQ